MNQQIIILSPEDKALLQRLLTKMRNAKVEGGKNTSTTMYIPRGDEGKDSPTLPYFPVRIRNSGENGESNYTNQLYWFEAVFNSNTDDNPNSQLTFEAFDSRNALIGTATNLAEQLTGSHSISVGSIVDVVAVAGNNGVIRYYFDSGGGGAPIGDQQFQVWTMVAQNEADWDWVRFSPET